MTQVYTFWNPVPFENGTLPYFTPGLLSKGEHLSNDVSLEDLVNAMLEISERLEYKKPRNTKIARKEISVKDKINYIKEILSREKKVEFTRLFNECTKEEIVVTFLSILEMSKDNLITLSQNKNFSKIYVEVYNE